MDVLPAIPDQDVRNSYGDHTETAIAITDKSSERWETSNPIGFCEWFKEQMREQFTARRKAMARTELTQSRLLPCP